MWSAREQHAVASDGEYIYVMGGFTSPQRAYCGPYACGDPWAGAYTGFMNVRRRGGGIMGDWGLMGVIPTILG
jgi:hypothetical protein